MTECGYPTGSQKNDRKQISKERQLYQEEQPCQSYSTCRMNDGIDYALTLGDEGEDHCGPHFCWAQLMGEQTIGCIALFDIHARETAQYLLSQEICGNEGWDVLGYAVGK